MGDLTKGLRLIAWSLEGGNVRMATDVRQAADALDAIDALHGDHNVYEWDGITGRVRLDLCAACGYPWPCPTHRILHPEGGES